MFESVVVHSIEVVEKWFGERVAFHHSFQQFPWMMECVLPRVHFPRHQIHNHQFFGGCLRSLDRHICVERRLHEPFHRKVNRAHLDVVDGLVGSVNDP